LHQFLINISFFSFRAGRHTDGLTHEQTPTQTIPATPIICSVHPHLVARTSDAFTSRRGEHRPRP